MGLRVRRMDLRQAQGFRTSASRHLLLLGLGFRVYSAGVFGLRSSTFWRALPPSSTQRLVANALSGVGSTP